MMKSFLSYRFLIILAILLGLAPFYPEPHLVEKARMLLYGDLTRPIDIFDLFWHSWPLLLILFLLVRDLRLRREK